MEAFQPAREMGRLPGNFSAGQSVPAELFESSPATFFLSFGMFCAAIRKQIGNNLQSEIGSLQDFIMFCSNIIEMK
jgi:hypothetical protein